MKVLAVYTSELAATRTSTRVKMRYARSTSSAGPISP